MNRRAMRPRWGGAVLSGERRAADRTGDGDAVLLRRDLLDCERDRGIVEADGHVDLIGIEPSARNRGADIGLVLMVGGHDLDRLAEHHPASVLDRHARGDHRAGTAEVGIEAGLIVEDADANDAVGYLRLRGAAASSGRQQT